jgi:hypothetical protein
MEDQDYSGEDDIGITPILGDILSHENISEKAFPQ